MYQINKNADMVLSFIHSLGFEAFLVGGCVRDFLMNREIHDYDITTNCPASLLLKKAKEQNLKAIPTGLKHGTITFLVNNEPIEVTTYRVESSYTNHRAPDKVAFTNDLSEDLKRRDFTMNSLCMDKKQIIDLFNGQSDIENKIIRCIGNPNERFNEDALRILRAIRFSCTLGFHIEENTYQAIQNNAQLLSTISKERIRDELIKMLNSNQEDLLALLKNSSTLPYIIPEFELTYNVTQESPYHIYDVFTHTDKALNASIGYPLEIRLAILLHDIEKKNYKTIDDKGIAHFKKHAQASALLSRKILRSLRFDTNTIHKVSKLIYYHDYYVTPNKKILRKFLYKLNGDYTLAYDILKVQMLDNLGKHPQVIEEKNTNINECIQVIQTMGMDNEIFSIDKLAIDGNDVIQLGYTNKEIGLVLKQTLKYVVHHQNENTKERLLKIAGGMKNEIYDCK